MPEIKFRDIPARKTADFTLEMSAMETAVVMDALCEAHANCSDDTARGELGSVINRMNEQWRAFIQEKRDKGWAI